MEDSHRIPEVIRKMGEVDSPGRVPAREGVELDNGRPRGREVVTRVREMPFCF